VVSVKWATSLRNQRFDLIVLPNQFASPCTRKRNSNRLEENEMKSLISQQAMADALARIADTGTLNGAVLGASKKTVFGWMRKRNLTCEWLGVKRTFAEHVASVLAQHRLLGTAPEPPLDTSDYIERKQLLRRLREKRAELQEQQEQRRIMAAEAAEIGSSKWLKQQEPQKPTQPIITRGRISGQIKASIDRDSENLGSGRDGVAPGGFAKVTARRERVARKRGLPYSLFG
jgi:hypothetical protein